MTESEKPLIHEPLNPIREDVVGERIFVEEWQTYLNQKLEWPLEDRHRFSLIFMNHCIIPGQREATVCASLMKWFGTNLGRDFLERAQARFDKEGRKSTSFLELWAVENYRQVYLNRGIRILEWVMSEHRAFDQYERYPIVSMLTLEDYETAEHLVMWLSTIEGQAFLSRCREKIKARVV